MISLLIVVLIVLLLGGWGYGYRAGTITPENPIGLIVFLIILVLVIAAVLGPNFGWWRYW